MKATNKIICLLIYVIVIMLFCQEAKAGTLKNLAAPTPAVGPIIFQRQSYKCTEYLSLEDATWKGRIGDKILSFLKPDMRTGEPVIASVRVFFHKDGRVKKVFNRGSSGDDKLDLILIEAVHKAGPFKEAANLRKKKYKKDGVIFEYRFIRESVEYIKKYHERCVFK